MVLLIKDFDEQTKNGGRLSTESLINAWIMDEMRKRGLSVIDYIHTNEKIIYPDFNGTKIIVDAVEINPLTEKSLNFYTYSEKYDDYESCFPNLRILKNIAMVLNQWFALYD